MKTIVAIMMAVLISGCGQSKTIDGEFYDTVGLFDEKDPCINYEKSIGNIVWSIVLFETIVVPVYFLGFSMFNPMSKKQSCKGQNK